MDEAPAVVAFRDVISAVHDFAEASSVIGEPLATMASMVERAFDSELQFIIQGIQRPCPGEAQINMLIEPLSRDISDIQEFRDRNRHITQFFNHLSTISESIVALSWIGVTPAPAQFVRDMRDAGEYFGNRVLAANKGNLVHTEFIQKWSDILKSLEKYIRLHHLTGFSWNSAPRAPPPPTMPHLSYGPAGDQLDRHALMSEINQGVDIVRMLRPIRREEVGAGDFVPPPPPAVPPPVAVQPAAVQPAAAQPAAAQAVRSYPPKFFLDGKKWRVEHQKDKYSMVIENKDMSESLVLFKCQDSGLEVQNKMNSVTIDNCKRTTIVIHDIISSVEVIRCDRLKIQCNGHIPLINIDNSDSVQIFITSNSLDTEIISSNSTSCNVCLLAPDGDYVELAMPEQIRTVIVDRHLQSSVIEKI